MKGTISKEDLEKIRLFLPKKTGVKDAAKKAGCSSNAIYRVLKQDFNNTEIVKACLKIIQASAEKRLEFAKQKLEELSTEARV